MHNIFYSSALSSLPDGELLCNPSLSFTAETVQFFYYNYILQGQNTTCTKIIMKQYSALQLFSHSIIATIK